MRFGRCGSRCRFVDAAVVRIVQQHATEERMSGACYSVDRRNVLPSTATPDFFLVFVEEPCHLRHEPPSGKRKSLRKDCK
ncbi:unnamed protein product [Soboliphyme baturini]|uniref:Secreted protein n=1 Tax=Soboliphyme baturini TaxID=241478 RepID=A0A183JAU6_9BILA|nr:unnamed protein product [Soboliphyme baturini]